MAVEKEVQTRDKDSQSKMGIKGEQWHGARTLGFKPWTKG